MDDDEKDKNIYVEAILDFLAIVGMFSTIVVICFLIGYSK